jgi:(R,R)-butanediol dehydrogenase/meso-butanediol dehydrogenase/diacetyl reductase/L-iditol 2-dehydrogenase
MEGIEEIATMDGIENRVGKVVEPGVIGFETRILGPVAPGKARIRIVSSAICGSDLHIYKGLHPSVRLPVTIGHEFSGEIVELGEGAVGHAVGDRVTLEPVIPCGVCPACLHGEYGYCENINFTYRVGDGAMADYIDALDSHVFALPDAISWDAGALIEPLAVATHAVRRSEIDIGDKVIVFGAGAIGILIGAVCKRAGAEEVVVVDYADARLEAARDLGATKTVNPAKESVDDVVRDLSSGRGMDKAFECVGLESTFVQAMMSIRKNGLATMVGIFEKPEIRIPATRFVTHEIRIQGSQGYCWDFPAAIGLALSMPLDRLVTHHFPLGELQSAFETSIDRNAGAVKVLVHPRGGH